MTIELIRFEISFGSSILHNHTVLTVTYILQGVLIGVSKMGNTKFMMHRTEWIRNIWCYFIFVVHWQQYTRHIILNYICLPLEIL